MDFNKLRTFLLVAELESISKAASRLHRTQPAISHQIHRLEDEMGLVLLERRNARVYLTREGEKLAEYARARLREISDYVLELRNDSQSIEGILRIGVLDEVGEGVLFPIVCAFQKFYPLIQIQIERKSHTSLEASLIKNSIDFGLAVLYEERKRFETHPIFRYQRILVAAPSYLQEKACLKNFEDLLSLSLIDSQANLADFCFWLQKNAKHLVATARKRFPTFSVLSAKIRHQLLLDGFGIGLADTHLIKTHLEQGTLIKLFANKAKPINITIDIARRQTHTRTLLHTLFLHFALAYQNPAKKQSTRNKA